MFSVTRDGLAPVQEPVAGSHGCRARIWHELRRAQQAQQQLYDAIEAEAQQSARACQGLLDLTRAGAPQPLRCPLLRLASFEDSGYHLNGELAEPAVA